MEKSTLTKDEENEKDLMLEIRPIKNWHEWLSLWKAAKTIEERLGLLHVGFSVSLDKFTFDEKNYSKIDRLKFYFNVSDGWTYDYLLELPEDKGKQFYIYNENGGNKIKKPCALRQELAQKAFTILCLKYFSEIKLIDGDHRGDNFNDEWEGVIISEQFFPVIQNFFAVEKEHSENISIRNLSYSRQDDRRSHSEKQAVNFLLNLANFLWNWKEPRNCYFSNKEEEKRHIKYFTTTQTRINLAKPWMIEILNYLNRLDALQDQIFKLDKACLSKLKEIAFRKKLTTHSHPVANNRSVVTLDEACYLGSRAAWFLKEHELKIVEHKRLALILEAERKIEDAGQKIKKLTSK